ncbi:hypothetical protein Tco_0196585 [Tanacetum coccineum]
MHRNYTGNGGKKQVGGNYGYGTKSKLVYKPISNISYPKRICNLVKSKTVDNGVVKTNNLFLILEMKECNLEGNNSAKSQVKNATFKKGSMECAFTSTSTMAPNVASTSKGVNTSTNNGKSYDRVDEDSESGVDEGYDDTAKFMASGSGGAQNASVP